MNVRVGEIIIWLRDAAELSGRKAGIGLAYLSVTDGLGW